MTSAATAGTTGATDLSQWWKHQPPYWKTAFNEAFLGKNSDYAPLETDLQKIHSATVMRFAGPRAPYPNMRIELPNLSGLEGLKNLEILVVTHQDISDLRGIEQMTQLKSLFLFNNRITSLRGLEKMSRLEELYIQYNAITTLEPLRGLTRLDKLYCSNNELVSFEGITPAHARSLTAFYALPNPGVPQKEIIRLENRLGIRCLKG